MTSPDHLAIPPEYLSLTLREVLVLTGRAVPKEPCPTSTLAGALDTMARTIASEREHTSASDREWLARLFEALPADPERS